MFLVYFNSTREENPSMPTTWSQSYTVNTIFLNALGRLGFYSLLQILQDTAVGHAQMLHLGKADMLAQNMFWVLTRQKVEVRYWPKFGEVLHTKTWLRIQEDGVVVRDFQLSGPQGEDWGRATTTWLALSVETRRPVKIDAYKMLAGIALTDSTQLSAPKIQAPKSFTPLCSFQARNSDLDGNNHVNNTRYAQWILDAVPFERHRAFVVEGYEVNFLAETRLGDTIRIERADAPDSPESSWITYRGVRPDDQKVVFLARLSPRPLAHLG